MLLTPEDKGVVGTLNGGSRENIILGTLLSAVSSLEARSQAVLCFTSCLVFRI